jgi:hypothetical protein
VQNEVVAVGGGGEEETMQIAFETVKVKIGNVVHEIPLGKGLGGAGRSREGLLRSG